MQSSRLDHRPKLVSATSAPHNSTNPQQPLKDVLAEKVSRATNDADAFLEVIMAQLDAKEDLQPILDKYARLEADLDEPYFAGAVAIATARKYFPAPNSPRYSDEQFQWLLTYIPKKYTPAKLYTDAIIYALNMLTGEALDKKTVDNLPWEKVIIHLLKNDLAKIQPQKLFEKLTDTIKNGYLASVIGIQAVHDIHLAAINYFFKSYSYYKDKGESRTASRFLDYLSSYFRQAITWHSIGQGKNDKDLTLLKVFMQLKTDPNFRLRIRAFDIYNISVGSPVFYFLSKHFHADFKNAVRQDGLSWQNAADLQTVLAFDGVSPRILARENSRSVKTIESKNLLNQYGRDVLAAINDYVTQHHAEFAAHRYSVSLLGHEFVFFGRKKITLQGTKVATGIGNFVTAHEQATKNPEQAFALLNSALDRCHDIYIASHFSRPPKQKPQRRTQAAQNTYEALGNWDLNSEIVKHIIASLEKKKRQHILQTNPLLIDQDDKNTESGTEMKSLVSRFH